MKMGMRERKRYVCLRSPGGPLSSRRIVAYLLLLLATLSIGCPLVSAQSDEVSALPVWPGTAVAARDLKGQYVFRDQNGQIVVSYPDPADPARTVTFRFWLQNRVDPHISVTLGRNAEGEFTYDYTLRNGLAAKTGIWAWSVVGPPSKDLTISHPVWHGINPYMALAAPQALPLSAPKGVFLNWSDASAPIAPGGQASGFEIVTRLRPGFTTAFVNGKEAPIRSPAELTEEVERQIVPLERAPTMYKAALTIGPRFGARADSREILLAYDTDVRGLGSAGFLDEGSLFIREIEQSLSLAITSDRRSIEEPKAKPASEIEKELLAALELALAR